MTLAAIPMRFADPETWNRGSSRGLSLRYGGSGTDRLRSARDALWTFPGLEGCWPRRDREPAPASRITSTWGLKLYRPLYGIARLPGTGGVACGAVAREHESIHDDFCPLCHELGLDREGPEGWLDFQLAFGALGQALQVGDHPFADGSSLLAWRDGVDGWLRALAEHVHRAAPFDLALVGGPDWMFGPFPHRPEEIREKRALGYLFPGPSGLTWFPPSMGAPDQLGNC